jgi:hypothetical protein
MTPQQVSQATLAFTLANGFAIQLITLSTALIGLTVTFAKDFQQNTILSRLLLIAIWVVFLFSIVWGIFTIKALITVVAPLKPTDAPFAISDDALWLGRMAGAAIFPRIDFVYWQRHVFNLVQTIISLTAPAGSLRLATNVHIPASLVVDGIVAGSNTLGRSVAFLCRLRPLKVGFGPGADDCCNNRGAEAPKNQLPILFYEVHNGLLSSQQGVG